MSTIRTSDERVIPVVETDPTLRTPVFVTRRRHWPGILAAAILGAGIAAVVVSSFYDDRSIGQKIDATVAAGSSTVRDGAQATGRVAGAFDDAGITAAVKTALAADPALSALKIDVSTDNGVVRLVGPAPDEKARERAAVLAAAPKGVQSVDNRLVVTPGG